MLIEAVTERRWREAIEHLMCWLLLVVEWLIGNGSWNSGVVWCELCEIELYAVLNVRAAIEQSTRIEQAEQQLSQHLHFQSLTLAASCYCCWILLLTVDLTYSHQHPEYQVFSSPLSLRAVAILAHCLPSSTSNRVASIILRFSCTI